MINFNNSTIFKLTISILLLIGISCHCALSAAPDVRQSPNSKRAKQISHNTTIDCSVDLSILVQVCSEPLMQIITGTLKQWPKNDKDVQDLCDSFITTERCIKDVGRKCAKNGLHKTILGVLSSSVQRVRKAECQKKNLPNILRLTQCVEKMQQPLQLMVSNFTNSLTVIEQQITDLTQKTHSVCCMIDVMEQEIRNLYDNRCPQEGSLVVRMYKAVLEDTREIICLRKSNCNNFLKGHRVQNTKLNEGIISLLLKIVFSLGD